MTALFSGSDISFMTDTLAQIGSWVEQGVTVFAFSSVTSSGTADEAGIPQTVTFGTRSETARIDGMKADMIEKSAGKYQRDDRQFSIRGSFTNQDMLVSSDGTYQAFDGPWKIYFGSHLYWQAVCRRVQS